MDLSICLPLWQYHTVFITVAMSENWVDFIFSFKNWFRCLSSFCFPYKFEVILLVGIRVQSSSQGILWQHGGWGTGDKSYQLAEMTDSTPSLASSNSTVALWQGPGSQGVEVYRYSALTGRQACWSVTGIYLELELLLPESFLSCR